MTLDQIRNQLIFLMLIINLSLCAQISKTKLCFNCIVIIFEENTLTGVLNFKNAERTEHSLKKNARTVMK